MKNVAQKNTVETAVANIHGPIGQRINPALGWSTFGSGQALGAIASGLLQNNRDSSHSPDAVVANSSADMVVKNTSPDPRLRASGFKLAEKAAPQTNPAPRPFRSLGNGLRCDDFSLRTITNLVAVGVIRQGGGRNDGCDDKGAAERQQNSERQEIGFHGHSPPCQYPLKTVETPSECQGDALRPLQVATIVQTSVL